MKYYIEVLRKYAVFGGRARRKEYWMFVLFNTLFSIVASVLDGVFNTTPIKFAAEASSANGPIASLYSLVVLVPSVAVGVRRLHDTDRSGWWMFLPFAALPLVLVMFFDMLVGGILAAVAALAAVITLLVFYTQDGTPGDNKYGPNPKEAPVVSAPQTPA
jgi:uncharacterized membrane protein YhaH (DUF805 family)